MARKKKRKDGYMTGSFTVDGKRYFVYGHSAKELNEKESRKREELRQGIEKRKLPTVTQYYERWSERRTGIIKESTHRGQEKMFNAMKVIQIPAAGCAFGDIKLQDVTIDDLNVLQGELLQKRRTQTVNDYLAHLKHVMNDAMKERVIDYNPCVLLKPLKRIEEKARDTHHRALSIEEQTAFFQSDRAKRSSYYNVFMFAILTGMRCGEIGALKYTDIRDGMIHVERTITRTQSGRYRIGEDAKTEAGRRTIPVNDEIREVLERQRYISRLLYGNVVSINETVFKAPEGGLLMATPADRELKTICTQIGIKPFTMHAFRATFATRAIEAGMNPRTLQELLGHSNFNITMSLYGHVLTDTKAAAMKELHIALK